MNWSILYLPVFSLAVIRFPSFSTSISSWFHPFSKPVRFFQCPRPATNHLVTRFGLPELFLQLKSFDCIHATYVIWSFDVNFRTISAFYHPTFHSVSWIIATHFIIGPHELTCRTSKMGHSVDPLAMFFEHVSTCSSGWWLSLPLWKYEFVSWDEDNPNIWKNTSHVPNRQPVIMFLPFSFFFNHVKTDAHARLSWKTKIFPVMFHQPDSKISRVQ